MSLKQDSFPSLVRQIVQLICKEELQEMLLGDLQELHNENRRSNKKWKANLLILKDALDICRPNTWKKIKYIKSSPMTMYMNYLKTSWRNFKKERMYSTINLIGLAIAIASATLIVMYLQFQLEYDQFHSNKEEIFRLARIRFEPDSSIFERDPFLPFPLAEKVMEDFPQIEKAVRIQNSNYLVNNGSEPAYYNFLWTDSEFLQVFTFPLQQGDAATALKDPNSVVLSSQSAAIFFPDGEAVGQTLQVKIGDEFQDLVVTGITKEIPRNSSLRFDMIIPIEKVFQSISYFDANRDNWGFSAFITYIKIKENADLKILSDQFIKARRQYYPNEMEQLRSEGLWSVPFDRFVYKMQPLTDIHFNPNYRGGGVPPVNPISLWILAGTAGFLVLLGCLNFTLLALGKSGKRSREIGMRKTVGALRHQLISQFWFDSLFQSFAALIAAVILILLVFPTFKIVADLPLSLKEIFTIQNSAILLIITVVTGLVAGFYPAIVISRFTPQEALKGKIKIGQSSFLVRGMLTIQFIISVFSIFAALIMNRQVNYVLTKDLGFKKQELLFVHFNSSVPEDVGVYKDKINQYSFVKSSTGLRFSFPLYANIGWSHEGNTYKAYLVATDTDFIEAFGIDILAGRDFNPHLATDSTESVIINEAFLDMLGWSIEEALNKPIPGYRVNEPRVIGVVKNFNFNSLENKVQPVIISIDGNAPPGLLAIRMNMNDVTGQLDALRSTWKSTFPISPFNYEFVEDRFNAEYIEFRRWKSISSLAMWITITISCMGLFGFATLHLSGRNKEIGVRKVFGGTSQKIMWQVSRPFALLVVLGTVVALPVSHYLMEKYLLLFAFHIKINILYYLIPVILVFLVMAFSLGYHGIRLLNFKTAQILKED